MVVGFHANSLTADAGLGGPPVLHAVRDNLDAGVELFFVLSGYLITGPFLRAVLAGRALPSLRAYAVRRAARILPAYWLVLPIALAWARGTAAEPQGWHLLPHLVLLHGLVPGETFRPLDLSWTLSVEILYYGLVPLAALTALVRGRPRSARAIGAFVAGVWAVSAALAIVTAMVASGVADNALVLRGAPGCLGYFAPGVLVALAEISAGRAGRPLHARRHIGRRSMIGFAAPALAALYLGAADDAGFVVRNQLLAAAFGCLLLFAITRTAPEGRPVRVLASVGVVSYGLYLWHWAAGALLRSEGLRVGVTGSPLADWLIAWGILAAASLPVAAVSWRFVEAPCQRLGARSTARSRRCAA